MAKLSVTKIDGLENIPDKIIKQAKLEEIIERAKLDRDYQLLKIDGLENIPDKIMKQVKLEEIIERAKFDRILDLSARKLFALPNGISNAHKLTGLHQFCNLIRLPNNFDNLTDLIELYLDGLN